MSLDQAMKNMKLDRRLQEWAMKTNQLTKEELEKHLEKLPDLKERAEYFNLADDRLRSESH